MLESSPPIACATLAGRHLSLYPHREEVQPHTEHQIRGGLSRLPQERLEFSPFGELLVAGVVERLTNLRFRDSDVQIGRFAEYPVGGDQESCSCCNQSRNASTSGRQRQSPAEHRVRGWMGQTVL
jgi:hypothetical protein